MDKVERKNASGRVTVAESAGFCFGVKRAVQLVYDEAAKDAGHVYTLGPIIHNEYVVDDLKKKGVGVIDDDLICEDTGEIPPEGSVIIIRSHGVSEEMHNRIRNRGYRVVDATCPFVKEDAKNMLLPKDKKIALVSQTTFNYDKFQELVEIITFLGYHVVVANTICNATRERQKEAMDLAARSDVMIVIGGKNSSNTQKLYDICRSQCANTYYIQDQSDLQNITISSESRVGITAGASTPNTIIQEVSQNVRGTEF